MLLSALSAHLDDVDANVDAGVGVGVFRFVDVVADVDVHDVLSTATLFQVFANLLHFFPNMQFAQNYAGLQCFRTLGNLVEVC